MSRGCRPAPGAGGAGGRPGAAPGGSGGGSEGGSGAGAGSLGRARTPGSIPPLGGEGMRVAQRTGAGLS